MPRLEVAVPGIAFLIDKLDIRKAFGPDQTTLFCLNVPEFVECLA